MDVNKLKHDTDKAGVNSRVEGARWIATGDFAITFPARYLSGALGSLTNTYNPVGYLAVISNDSYAVTLIPMQIPLRPEKASIYTHDGEDYMLLEWTKDGVICDNLRLVQNNANVFSIHNEFISRGKTPWYFSVSLRAEIYRNNKRHAGVDLGGGIPLESVLVASITRDKNNRRLQARYTYKSQEDYDKSNVVTISLIDIGYGAKSGTSRTIGGYSEDGYVAELVEPTESVDKLEQLMRT